MLRMIQSAVLDGAVALSFGPGDLLAAGLHLERPRTPDSKDCGSGYFRQTSAIISLDHSYMLRIEGMRSYIKLRIIYRSN